jgi:hypothetical protein
MSWLRFWQRDDDDQSLPPASDAAERPLPPHLAAARERAQPETPPDRIARRAAELHRRRQAALFDIAQGELASSEDNPWQERIALLSEALATVNDDLARLDNTPPEPYAPLPETPITHISVGDDEPPSVRFSIGDRRFVYAEEIDWAERGHQVTRGELRRQEGDPTSLVPRETPPDVREALDTHLTESLFVFASDLRDRVLDGEPLPSDPTLADLGRPCDACGGWLDWRGRCQACARRNAERLSLKRELDRLMDERASEAEERHRFAERLPVARRRLADVEIELNALERAGARE